MSSDGTLKFTSKAILNGSDELTIAVNNVQKSYTKSFDFAVSPVGDPLIVLINSQVITPANSKVSFLLGNSVTIPVSITDVDGDIVTLSASASQSFIKPVVTNVSPNNFLVTISGTAEGTGYVTLYINDQVKTTTVRIQVKIDLITAIEEEPISIKVYPNPTDDFIFVEGDDLKGQATLVSVSGQVVSRTDVNGNFVKIDTKAMLTGVYLLKVMVRNNVYTYRVIKSGSGRAFSKRHFQ